MAQSRKINWPKYVDIGGRRIPVSFVRLDGANGQFLIQEYRIEICTGLSFVETLNTLRHEMMEAALFISGVGYSSNYDQEPVVRCLENLYLPAQDKLLVELGLANRKLLLP